MRAVCCFGVSGGIFSLFSARGLREELFVVNLYVVYFVCDGVFFGFCGFGLFCVFFIPVSYGFGADL